MAPSGSNPARVDKPASGGNPAPDEVRGLRAEARATGRRGASRLASGLSRALCVASIVLALCLAAGIPLLVGRFREMFEEAGLALPALTSVLLYARGWGWSAALLVLIGALLANEFGWQAKTRALAVNFLALLVLICFVLLVVIALFLPLITVVQSASEAT